VIYEVSFTDGALVDLRAAQAWYENKVTGLGARFTESVLRQAKSLENMPDKYRLAAKDIHVCSVPKFPFELYYKIEERRVVVLVVHAVRQDPTALAGKFFR